MIQFFFPAASRQMANSFRSLSCAAGLMAVALPVSAAELKPPLQSLRHHNFTLISAERVDQPVTDGSMSVRVLERLRGDPDVPDRIELLVLAGDHQHMQIGQSYLLFYSDVERVSFKVRKEVRRPDRRKLLHIDGADPAVFPDTPANRKLFNPVLANPEQDPQYRAVVIQALQSDDPAMVDLWSAEWALRPSTFSEIRRDETEVMRAIIEDPAQRPAARARILQAGAERTPPGQANWYADSARKILGQIDPAVLHENPGLSQLIYASLQVARTTPEASSAAQLEKWLRSTPPLAERAAIALRAISPELENEAVRVAIADDATPGQTRTFLTQHLRRVELADARSG